MKRAHQKRHQTIKSRVRALRDVHMDIAVIRLYRVRASIASSDYDELADAFRNVAKKRQEGLTRRLTKFSDLYWLPGDSPVTLEREFEWARVLLTPVTRSLSTHADRVAHVQELVERGQLADVVREAHDSVREFGWTYWALSAEFCALSAAGETAQLANRASELQGIGAGRNSGLLARIVADRNDRQLPFNTFEARCKDFFERTKDPSKLALYKARSLSILEDEDQCARLLACDVESSFVDYYESLLKVGALVCDTEEASPVSVAAVACFTALSRAGLRDRRLDQLCDFLKIAPLEEHSLTVVDRSLFARCLAVGVPEPDVVSNGALELLHTAVTSVEHLGLAADDQSDELLRAASNFDFLPLGRALWQKGVQPFVRLEDMPLVAGGKTLDMDAGGPYQLLTQTDAFIVSVLSGMPSDRARDIVRAIDSGEPIIRQTFDAFDVWLARSLIHGGHPGAGAQIARALRSAGGAWAKYGGKLLIHAAAVNGELDVALRLCAEDLVSSRNAAHELPLDWILQGRRWSELAQTPIWLVAIAAHFASLATSSSRHRFTCRMACRDLYRAMHAEGVEEFLKSKDERDRALLAFFFRIGWTDENLSMVSELASTQDVRRERLQLFQVLLAMDADFTDQYKEIIQALTLDETLWAGLREIDSNRVFVNEPAISRWAEKELVTEYERWRALRSADEGSEKRIDQLLRTYLIDHDIDALLGALPRHQQSEASAVMLGIITKLFARFLTDPANGLNSYLSLRVRHGTLRGVLLGQIEEERLLLSGEYSQQEFEERWSSTFDLTVQERSQLMDRLRCFGKTLDALAASLVSQKVQIRSVEKPEGMFASTLDAASAGSVFAVADPAMSFNFFLNQCYSVFWEALATSRNKISQFFLTEVAENLQREFEQLIAGIADIAADGSVRALVDTLKTLSIRSADSCAIIAGWFLPVKAGEEQTYSLSSAIGIASRATTNVYRDFKPELKIDGESASDVHLSTSGLSVVYDSLFVVLGNAWVHSGLGDALGPINVHFSYDDRCQVLQLRVENRLSDARRQELIDGELAKLQARYCGAVPWELVSIEGGSGFAKLARIAAAVDRTMCPNAMQLDITDEGSFFVLISVQLYKREGVFDAYL